MKPKLLMLHKSSHRSQQGIGMIEVLISLLILSIGLLGMAALQARGLTMTTESLQRTQATILAHDIIERARANRVNAAGYNVDLPAPVCTQDFAISNATVATDDINEWRNNLACLLANGNGTVRVVNNTLTVTVTWNDRTETDTEGDALIADRARLIVTAGI